MRHLVGISVGVACIILCMLLPFLPGDYDGFAMPLSMMAQIFAKTGLLLVPVGLLWAALESRSRSAAQRRRLEIATVIVTAVVWTTISIGAGIGSRILGFMVLGLGVFVLGRLMHHILARKAEEPARASVVPIYLIAIPTAVAFIQLGLAEPVSEWSRSRVIRHSAPLIAAIEQYRTVNGRYPQSLVALHRDYATGAIGVERYHYKPQGDSYNVLVEHVNFRFGTREIVMYNPRDEQTMTSHTIDILELTPAQLVIEHTRGYNEVHAAREPHWKYFWFD